MSNDVVIQTFPLGPQWPTIDPFLFCAHHDDAYPVGDDRLAPPAASLVGRDMGMDFEGRDGWRMYHGQVVPGFPAHPHRGFETVTYVRTGFIDHSDSLGATARFGKGDVQWITTGSGLVHCEMFPLLEPDRPNPLELFQIWLNLPAADKMVDAHFSMLWSEDVPKVREVDDQARAAEITVIAGRLGDAVPPSPPPSSWASHEDADVAIWHIHLDGGATWTMPAAAGPETGRVLYVFEGSSVSIGDTVVDVGTGAAVEADAAVELTADADGPVDILVLQGRPIGEPVAKYGPFVLNDRAGIEQAMRDYQRTQFGGWPWDGDDPVHPKDKGRFAIHADGSVEEKEPAPAG